MRQQTPQTPLPPLITCSELLWPQCGVWHLRGDGGGLPAVGLPVKCFWDQECPLPTLPLQALDGWASCQEAELKGLM